MPSLHQLTANRPITALRTVVRCPAQATALRQGPEVKASIGAAWLVFLCPAHTEALPAWPTVAMHTDVGSMTCGSVLDYRPAEQLLQSHADLWLTPLTGVDPRAFDGIWSDVLDQADRVLSASLDERQTAGNVDGPLQGIVTMLDMARRSAAEGDLAQAATALGYCETMALDL
ncbi:hypothetical protein [Streptomyces sp. NPDC091371]|uniref:hypothetical protein n=1 Tax=Streptomyces sp. NPDC091371 TaxID=3155303 RepID=UPI00342AC393